MKKFFLPILGVAVLFAASCKKNDRSGFDPEKELINGGGSGVDTLVGEITVNSTVTRTTYLKGIVFVKPGVTLTVNSGVTIKGSPGGAVPDLVNFENNKGTLVVEKGGRLNAAGTATSPIIWTSAQPAGSRNFGDWGGIVLLGNAPIVTNTGATTQIYEAFRTATPDPRFSYGGPTASDNSGTITFNRIEFAGGVVLIANQEVNGLTFAGVGNGTTVHHIEVSNNGDDAFEFFGGTVNAHHLLSFGNKDDDFDFDEAYNGSLQFLIAYRNDLADVSGSEFIESDGNSTAAEFSPHTTPTIVNATFVGPTSLTVRPGVTGTFDGGIWVRRRSRIRLANSLVIAQAFPVALGTTATSNPPLVNGADPDPSYIRNNIWQTASATPVVLDANEGNPIVGTADNTLIGILANATNQNSALATFADFKLNGALVPQAGSPALSGGLNLSGLNPFFVGTTQRGGVITTDQWTTTGVWISTATN